MRAPEPDAEPEPETRSTRVIADQPAAPVAQPVDVGPSQPEPAAVAPGEPRLRIERRARHRPPTDEPRALLPDALALPAATRPLSTDAALLRATRAAVPPVHPVVVAAPGGPVALALPTRRGATPLPWELPAGPAAPGPHPPASLSLSRARAAWSPAPWADAPKADVGPPPPADTAPPWASATMPGTDVPWARAPRQGVAARVEPDVDRRPA